MEKKVPQATLKDSRPPLRSNNQVYPAEGLDFRLNPELDRDPVFVLDNDSPYIR